MTLTYDITTTVGQIRLIIGDTDITDAVFTDEELTFFYTNEGSILMLGAAAAMEAWAAKYAVAADSEKIGDYSYTLKAVDKLNKLAKEIREKVAGDPYLTWAEMDLTIGSGITAEED